MSAHKTPRVRRDPAWRVDLQRRYETVREKPPPPPLPLLSHAHQQRHGTGARRAIVDYQSNPLAVADFLALRPAVELWPHQAAGVAFMAERMARNGGGMLCDHMRMGKTRTVLAFMLADLQRRLAHDHGARFAEPYLICCPKSLQDVWLSEYAALLPSAPFEVVLLGAASGGELARPCDLIVATYPQLQVPANAALLRRAWPRLRAVFCDEAHVLRNDETLAHAAIRTLTADAKWFISGTPLHNHLDNLRAALDLIGVAGAATADVPTLRHMLSHVYLSREAGPTLDRLPVTALDFAAPVERLLYDHARRLLHEDDLLPAASSSSDSVGIKNHTLRAINQLRKITLTPMMLEGDFAAGGALALPPALAAAVVWPSAGGSEAHRVAVEHMTIDALGGSVPDATARLLRRFQRDFFAARPGAGEADFGAAWTAFIGELAALSARLVPPVSPKERFVAHLLKRAERCGEKVVVFCNYVTPLTRLLAQCEWRQRPVDEGGVAGARGAVLVDGSLDDATRVARLRHFRESADVSVLLITLTIGYYGHDFSCARHAVLYDPWYNPKVELQAVHRLLGSRQTGDVFLHRLALRATIDEKIVAIADGKTQLALDTIPMPERVEEPAAAAKEEEEEEEDMMSIDNA